MAQALRGLRRGHTMPPAPSPIGPVVRVGANRPSPRRVRCPQTRVWVGRHLQGGVRGPEGGAAGKVGYQISGRIAPSSSAVMGLTLRIEAPREVAAGPSAGTEREDVRRPRVIADGQVLEDGEEAAVVVEAGAREEAGHRS